MADDNREPNNAAPNPDEIEEGGAVEPYDIWVDMYAKTTMQLVGKCKCGKAMIIDGEQHPGILDKMAEGQDVEGKCSICDHPIVLRKRLVADAGIQLGAQLNTGPNRHQRHVAARLARRNGGNG